MVSGRSCQMWTVASYMIIKVTFEPRLEEVEGAGQGGIWRKSVLSRSSCSARQSLKSTPDVFEKHQLVQCDQNKVNKDRVVGNMVKTVKKQTVWVFVGHCKGFGLYSE